MNRKDAQSQMIHDLERLQEEMQEKWLDHSIPSDWDGLDFWDDVKRKTTRVTIRLDADMVAWFRRMGPQYGPRINKVLRIYYAGIVSGTVSAYPNDNVVPRIILAAQQEMDKHRSDLTVKKE